MKLFTVEYLREKGIGILVSCGALEDKAAIISDELIEANLMDVDLHGKK